MPYFSHDDIAQICTPLGAAALGGIRISGAGAFPLLRAVCVDPPFTEAEKPRRGVFSCRLAIELLDKRGGDRRTLPCRARAFVMPAPHSYTVEDVVEVHLPGSPALLEAALGTFVRAGARAAAPGEFTFRAFRNGRISLGQAEAVEAVVRAGNDDERRRALSRLGDTTRARIEGWRERCLDMAALLEASLDFSDEELDGDPAAGLWELAAELEREGAVAGDGFQPLTGLPHAALTGLANAGKSSLFNALLGGDEALVSPESSTTRDRLRREVLWRGTRLVLSDNPGYDTEGRGGGLAAAERAFERLGDADVTCWVLDGSRLPGAAEATFAARLPDDVLLVVNKNDLPRKVDVEAVKALFTARGAAAPACLFVSAATGEGVGELRRALAERISRTGGEGVWNARERLELAAALAGCRAAAAELAGPGRLELAAEEARAALAAFSRARGDGYAEDVLARIFGSFCIGK